MPLSQLTVYRRDRRNRALITLSGEIDLESAPVVRVSLARCLRDGIRTIDVDLTPVTFCDCSGLNAFCHAAQQTKLVGGTLRLHHPPPTLTRIVDLAGCGFLLLGLPLLSLDLSLDLPLGHPPPPLRDVPAASLPALPQRPVPLTPVLSGDVRGGDPGGP